MKIEYAITAGEGKLLAYGVTDARYVAVDEYGIDILNDDPWDYGFCTQQSWDDEGVTLIARPCHDGCETGK